MQSKLSQIEKYDEQCLSLINLLSGLVDTNPLTRYTTWDALKHSFFASLHDKLSNTNDKQIKQTSDNERNDLLLEQWMCYQQSIHTRFSC